MDSKQFRSAAISAIDEIINYYDTIEERRVVSAVEPGYLKPLLPKGPPLEGEKWEDIQKDLESKIMPGLTHWQSPNFMAFFPCNSSFPGMLGELYSSAFNAASFNWICSPAVTELETIVLDWMAKLFNLPDGYLSAGQGGGVIQGTASEAVLVTMIAARDKYLRETTSHLSGVELEDVIAQKRGKLIALGGAMNHSAAQKAAQVAGVRYRSIPVSGESDFAMTGSSLETVIEDCKAQDLEPFHLTTVLGSTTCCSVDDFASIATVLLKMRGPSGTPGDIWVHVDAAYAGASLILPEYQHLTSSFQYFHSFNMNMHKWLLTNFDASLLYVQKRKHLIDALSITPAYLRNDFSERGLVTDYRDWQIPLGRRFRSLKIWFVLRTYGVKGLQNYLKNHIKLGQYFAILLQTRKDLFKIIAGPAFALTVFNIVPNTKGIEEQDKVTKDVYELINKRGDVYLTHSVLDDQYVIRVVSASPRTEEKHLRKCFDILVQTAEELKDAQAIKETADSHIVTDEAGDFEKAEIGQSTMQRD